MKKIKKWGIVALAGIIGCAAVVQILRMPNYSIRTSGTLVVINKLSSTITLFDLEKAKEIKVIPLEIEAHEVIPLSDQKQFVITNYGAPNVIGESISVLDLDSYQIEKTFSLHDSPRPHGITRIPNTDHVVVVTDVGNELLVMNSITGEILKRVSTGQKWSHMVVLHPEKPLAYVTNITSGSVSVIDLKAEKLNKIIPCGQGTEGIDITPDGKELWVSNSRENTISIIDTRSHEIIDTVNTGNEALRLKFSIDGTVCFVPNSKDGTIRVYDRLSRNLIKLIRIPGKKNFIDRAIYRTPRPVGILMHPNGKYVFVSNSNADKVEVIDMHSFEIVSTIGTGRVPDGLALLQ